MSRSLGTKVLFGLNVKEHFKRHPLKKSERNFVIAVLTVPLVVWYLLVRFFWSGLCRKRLECL